MNNSLTNGSYWTIGTTAIPVKETHMNDKDIRKIIDDMYDDSREDSLRSMMGDFYNRRMASTAILVWVIGLVCMAGAAYSAVAFLGADEVKGQILYATLFLSFLYLIGILKIFSWQLIHRNSIKRQIKRLELRIADLAKSADRRSEEHTSELQSPLHPVCRT